MRRILDEKYKKVELNKVMTKKFQHLYAEEREILLYLLRIFEGLFDGSTGTWNTKTVDLELKDDEKPV